MAVGAHAATRPLTLSFHYLEFVGFSSRHRFAGVVHAPQGIVAHEGVSIFAPLPCRLFQDALKRFAAFPKVIGEVEVQLTPNWGTHFLDQPLPSGLSAIKRHIRLACPVSPPRSSTKRSSMSSYCRTSRCVTAESSLLSSPAISTFWTTVGLNNWQILREGLDVGSTTPMSTRRRRIDP